MANVNACGFVLDVETPKQLQSQEYEMYTIKSGDSLSRIASKYKISVEKLMKLNGIKNANSIIAGVSIKIRSSKSAPQVSSANPVLMAKATDPIPMTVNDTIKPLVDAFERTTSVVPASDVVAADNVDEVEANGQCSEWKTPKVRRAEKEKRVLALTAYNAKKMEGYRSTAYKCTAGEWTVGYGHTKGVKEGDTMSIARAERTLRSDLQINHDDLKAAIPIEIYDKLSDYQLAALVDVCFNIRDGIEGFKKTDCYKLICEGKFDEAQTKMDVVYANKTDENGNVIKDKKGNKVKEVKPGLLIRRVQEMYLYGNGKLTPQTDARIKELMEEEMASMLNSLNNEIGYVFKGINQEPVKVTVPIKSLEEAGKQLKSQLNALEVYYQSQKKKDPNFKAGPLLRKMRNRQALFEVIADPEKFLATIGKQNSLLARK